MNEQTRLISWCFSDSENPIFWFSEPYFSDSVDHIFLFHKLYSSASKSATWGGCHNYEWASSAPQLMFSQSGCLAMSHGELNHHIFFSKKIYLSKMWNVFVVRRGDVAGIVMIPVAVVLQTQQPPYILTPELGVGEYQSNILLAISLRFNQSTLTKFRLYSYHPTIGIPYHPICPFLSQ